MNWFLAKIVFRITCGDGNHTAQFDEQLRLIHAGDEARALEKARAIGCSEQETFYNNRQQLVRWSFIDVSELHQVNGFVDGAELYARISEVDDAADYIRVVQRKAEAIGQRSTCLTSSN